MEKKIEVEGLKEEVQKALSNPETSKIYANGFVNALGAGDIVVILKNADTPVAILNLSYTVAKTLAVKLGSVISELEKKTGNMIMTTDQINKAMSKDDEE